MPRHADVTVPANVWTLLTDPDDVSITGVQLQNLSGTPMRVQAKADASPIGLTVGGALLLLSIAPIAATDTLANLFPGVTSPLHLFALSPTLAEVSVSHA